MNGYGNSVFLRTAWEVSGGVPPVNTVAPAITGTAQEGQIVTCSTGTWTGTPTITFAYQWKRNGSNIGSATNSTYTLVTADVSQSITCQVTATNGAGSASATSNTITPIAAVDPDAQAFITAAAITNPTQQAAINTLVVDLKGYSIWTKMRALYPFVGGTASTHKFNLKNPLDTNAAYRLTFFGGVTHSSNGIIGNGTNGYGDTFLNHNVMAQNDAHISLYSRTNVAVQAYDMGSYNGSTFGSFMYTRGTGNTFVGTINNGSWVNQANTDSRGFYLVTRKSAISQTGQKNATQYVTASSSNLNIATSFKILRVGEYNGEYSPRNLAFASIGDGLTDTEAANFYTAVQAFNTTLGRSIGTQTVSDADAQAFVTNAGIVDQVEANAINNLVIGMKADGLWTKMKAVYPFVGGTATTHKFNLKNPLDTDAAFRLMFNGGVTHSSTGVQGNGTNGYADTKWVQNVNGTINNQAIGIYIRTNNTYLGVDMGARIVSSSDISLGSYAGSPVVGRINTLANFASIAGTPQGFYQITRNGGSSQTVFLNGSSATASITISTAVLDRSVFLMALNDSNLADEYHSNRQIAFSYISDGLTDTEAANFNTRVTTFQTSLNRNI